MILVAPLVYSICMGYWSYVWISVVGFIDPSGYISVAALMVLGNTLGIIAIGILLSMPLIKTFRESGYVASIAVATSIVAWSVYNLFTHGQQMPSSITIIEWLAVILVVPILGHVLYKRFNEQGRVRNA